MLHAIRLKNGQKIDEQDIILDDKCNYQKAELIFGLLDKYNKQKVDEEEDIYFIDKVSITTAYRDGTIGGEELTNTLYREGYELGRCHIDNIISIKCKHNDNSEQLCFSGRIDNDPGYEFNLEIKPNEEYINDQLIANYIKEFKKDYEMSTEALDEYIAFCTNFGTDSVQKIYEAMLECMKNIRYDKKMADRKGAIDYLKHR